MLEVRDLTKVYYEDPKEQTNALLVLDHVSLSVPKNQFVCLLGPSGCGKTTLLRVVVGLVAPLALALLAIGLTGLIAGPALAQNLQLDLGDQTGSATGRLLQLFALITVLSLAPSMRAASTGSCGNDRRPASNRTET